MGLDINSVLFLLAARKRGADFSNVLMIGRQDLNVYPAKMQQVLTQAGLAADLFAPGAPDTGFAEPFFKALGARKISALDASAFEGAEFVHDLNRPINDDLKQKFDLVYDGGTLEHVFNFPVALQNCLEMVNEGGRFITQTCANNWCGHGFYQFSPELFYNVLGDDNGFEVERMIIHMVGPYGRWYEVANPREIESRVELFNSFPLQLLVQARRKRIVPLFAKTPQQSDYTPRWAGRSPELREPLLPARPQLAKILPGVARLRNVLKIGWKMWRGNSLANRKKFKPVKKSGQLAPLKIDL
jgi:SAM-dependent methyltransferase